MKNLIWIVHRRGDRALARTCCISGRSVQEIATDASDAVNAPEALESATAAVGDAVEATEGAVTDAVEATTQAANTAADALAEAAEDVADAAAAAGEKRRRCDKKLADDATQAAK